MTHADVDITIRSKSEVQGLPEELLSLRFIPIPSLSLYAERHEELSFGTEFHYGIAILVADPHIVVRIDGHAVRLVLVADHILADRADKLMILVELKQLRFSSRIALKRKEVIFRVDGDG
jgi:hypothetical protein